MTTGQLIRAARKKAKMTQAELAKKLGISYVGVSQWENDLRNPKYETICRIAAALDVEFADLVPPEVGGKMIVDHVLGRLKNLQSPIERVTRDMSQMTQEGQEKVADYAADILPRYKRPAAHTSSTAPQKGTDTAPPPNAPETPPAPQEGTDTTPPADAPEGPPEGGETV